MHLLIIRSRRTHRPPLRPYPDILRRGQAGLEGPTVLSEICFSFQSVPGADELARRGTRYAPLNPQIPIFANF